MNRLGLGLRSYNAHSEVWGLGQHHPGLMRQWNLVLQPFLLQGLRAHVFNDQVRSEPNSWKPSRWGERGPKGAGKNKACVWRVPRDVGGSNWAFGDREWSPLGVPLAKLLNSLYLSFLTFKVGR